MKSINNCALTINRGSSSIKFALYESDGSLTRLLFGEMENMGLKNTRLNYNYSDATQKISVDIKAGGLQFLGIELEETNNIKNDAIISTGTSQVTVRVMKTNEELMIARLVCHVLK